MTENMKARPHADDSFAKLRITCRSRVVIGACVEYPIRGPVGDQDVSPQWDAVVSTFPLLRIAAAERTTVVRCQRRAPDSQSIDADGFIHKKSRVGDQLSELRSTGKDVLMITWHEDLMRMGQFSKPFIEIFDRLDGPPEESEVSSVNEQVTWRYGKAAV